MPGPSTTPTLSWWDSLLLFLGLAGKDKEKYLIFKGIRNNLKTYGRRFFHVGPDLAEPTLAKMFYDIYVCVGPAQTLFLNLQNSPALKNIIVEGSLPAEALELLRALDDEAINAKAQQQPIEKVGEECQQIYGQYSSYFTPELIRKIDSRYRTTLAFFDLLKFNFYFFLKKFDSNLPERDFNYRPKFEKIHGSYLVEDLREFWEIGAHFPVQADWDSVFDALKAYKNLEPVNRGWWKRVLQHIQTLQQTEVIPLIIQYVSQDLTYQVVSKPEKDTIVENHLNTVKSRVDVTLSKIKSQKRRSTISKLVLDIFGTENVSWAKNYTDKANAALSKKNVGTFTYVEGINYLKAFLIEHCKKTLRELTNHLVIKGQWLEMANSKALSEGLHRIMEISDRVVAFDDSLSEDGERGSRLKSHLMKSDRDTNALGIVKNMVRDINGLAKTLMVETGNELISIGKILKAVIEDMPKQKHEVIVNWRQLESSFEGGNLKEALLKMYRQLFNFVQLIQYFIKEG